MRQHAALRRMEKAKQSLKTGDAPVDAMARAAKYSNLTTSTDTVPGTIKVVPSSAREPRVFTKADIGATVTDGFSRGNRPRLPGRSGARAKYD